MKKNIYIIIPTFNEEKNILPLITVIRNNIPNSIICIVDDSPEDKIKKLLNREKIKKIFYFHRKNTTGRGSAVLFGLKKIYRKKKEQIFIEMDADFSHNPLELKRNINFFIKNKSDLLISSRYLPKSKIINWPLSRRLFSRMSNLLAILVLNIKVSDYTNGFRIYSSNAVNLVLKKCGKIGDGFIILSEILLAVDINNFRINEINSIFVNRLRGKSSVNIFLIIKSLFGLFKLFLTKKSYILKQ